MASRTSAALLRVISAVDDMDRELSEDRYDPSPPQRYSFLIPELRRLQSTVSPDDAGSLEVVIRFYEGRRAAPQPSTPHIPPPSRFPTPPHQRLFGHFPQPPHYQLPARSNNPAEPEITIEEVENFMNELERRTPRAPAAWPGFTAPTTASSSTTRPGPGHAEDNHNSDDDEWEAVPPELEAGWAREAAAHARQQVGNANPNHSPNGEGWETDGTAPELLAEMFGAASINDTGAHHRPSQLPPAQSVRKSEKRRTQITAPSPPRSPRASSSSASPAAPAASEPVDETYWPNVERWLTTRSGPRPVVLCVCCTEELVIPGLQSDNGEREETRRLECGHLLGAVCIGAWISDRRGTEAGARCPFCQYPIED